MLGAETILGKHTPAAIIQAPYLRVNFMQQAFVDKHLVSSLDVMPSDTKRSKKDTPTGGQLNLMEVIQVRMRP